MGSSNLLHTRQSFLLVNHAFVWKRKIYHQPNTGIIRKSYFGSSTNTWNPFKILFIFPLVHLTSMWLLFLTNATWHHFHDIFWTFLLINIVHSTTIVSFVHWSYFDKKKWQKTIQNWFKEKKKKTPICKRKK
jgi:hypothetical protein